MEGNKQYLSQRLRDKPQFYVGSRMVVTDWLLQNNHIVFHHDSGSSERGPVAWIYFQEALFFN